VLNKVVRNLLLFAVVATLGAWEGVAQAAPSHVQGKTGYVGSGRSVSATLDRSATAGNLIAVYVVWSNTSAATVTDSRGNTYAPAGAARTTWAGSYSAQVFYAKNVAGGPTTVKATFGGSVFFGIVYAHEYSGLDTASPFDGGKVAKGTGTALSSGSISTTGATDLLFGAGASVGAVSDGGAGFTVRSLDEGNITEDRVVDQPGSYSATATHGGGGWVMQVAAFKAAGGGGGPGDTTPPSVPAGVTATATSSTSVRVDWGASTDDAGVAGYRVYRDGALLATTTGTTYPDSGLQPGTTYAYTVAAYDAAGNASDQSAPASVTTPPSAPSGCALPSYPDASCTGVPPGTQLTVVNGDMTITTPNTVIDGMDIRGSVIVDAPGVVIRRSKITSSDFIAVGSFGGAYTGTGLVIEDSEISCNNWRRTAIGDTNFTARRVNIHGCENGFDLDGPALIEDSYIHDLYNDDIAHTDGAQLTDVAHDITFRHNRIYSNDGTSAIISPDVHAGVARNILIEDNLLAGGAYTLYCPQNGPGVNYRVIDNHFSTVFYPTVGAFAPWTDCGDEAQVTGNVFQETGLPVPLD
jgi:Fibronectin type III domain